MIAPRIWIGLTAVVLLGSACGSAANPQIAEKTSTTSKPSASAPPVTHQLQVGKVGFGQDQYGLAFAVALLTNPSNTDGAESTTVQFSAYDANNQVIGTATESLTLMRAGQAMASGNMFTVPQGAKIALVKAQVATETWAKDPHPEAVILTQNTKFNAGQYGNNSINGELVSKYQSNLKQVIATAVCYDGGANIIVGGFTFVDLLPGGGTAGVTIHPTVTATPASCEMYGNISNLSLIGT